MAFWKNQLATLNLFHPRNGEDEDEYDQRTNILSTRIYIIFILIVLLIFTLALSLIPYARMITIESPSRSEYESLVDVSCQCSRISFTYDQFVSIEASFHQVCSSDFISMKWIRTLDIGDISKIFRVVDIRTSGYLQFQSLAHLCQLSQSDVNQLRLNFGSTSLISHEVFSRSILQSQVEKVFNQLAKTVPNTFQRQIELISAFLRSNKDAVGMKIHIQLSWNAIDGFQVGIGDPTYSDGKGKLCLCSTAFSCIFPSGIYPNVSFLLSTSDYLPPIWEIPGFHVDCLITDGILHSSLECFYDQTCVDRILSYFNQSTNFTAMTWSISASSFERNATVESIVSRLMVEEWLFNISYEKYYDQCTEFMQLFEE